MRTASRLATALFILALPVAIITTNVRILLSEPGFYERGFRKYDAELTTGIPLAELDQAGHEIVDYFFNDQPLLTITVEDEGQRVPLFNERERRHMEDVKQLVRVMLTVNDIALVYLATYIVGAVIWSRERSIRGLAWRTLAGVGLGLALGGAVAAAAFIGGFDAAWDRFHELFFPQGLWQFNPQSDRLIQMFPESFWQESSLFLLIMSGVEAAILVIAASVWLLFGRKPGTPSETRPDNAERPVTPPAAGIPPDEAQYETL